MHLCQSCGKSEAAENAGSLTSYLFQDKYCQCARKNKIDFFQTKRSTAKSIDPICLTCGKSRPKEKKAGSFTSYLFKELRCECAQPKFKNSREHSSGRSTVSDRAAEKRRLADRLRQQPTKKIVQGTVIGGTFEIQATIGVGAMGTVYLARHLALQRVFALKVLAANFTSESLWLRFQSEAKILAALQHPNLVNVYDLGVDSGTFYYSMDYLKGCNLQETLEKGTLSLESTIKIFLAVLDGLAYAHRNGIVHRDIKPANIFLSKSDTGSDSGIKILDFGISKFIKSDDEAQQLTVAGETFGSPYYMSPEQCSGNQVDARSDIYSVGCSIFETLSGAVPFEAESSIEIATMHEEEAPPLLSDYTGAKFPKSIDLVINKCLAKHPRDRYQSAKELALDLERILAGKEVNIFGGLSQQPHSEKDLDYEKSSEGRNIPIILMAVTLIIFTTGGGIIGWSILTSHPPLEISKPVADPGDVTAILSKDKTDLASVALVDHNTGQARSADIESYVQNHTGYYSELINTGGEKEKSFSFPTKFPIGAISYDNSQTQLAIGKVIVPAEAKLDFEASQTLAKNPILLSFFRPDDLYGLSFRAEDKISLSAVPHIAKLKSLKNLILSQMPFSADTLEYVSKLANLTSLEIEPSTGGAAALAKSQFLMNLKTLGLRNCDYLSDVLKALRRSENLTQLTLRETTLSDQDVDYICAIKKLNRLYLTKIALTDSQLAAMSAMKKLQYLDISPKTKLTPRCVESLKKFTGLKTLVITGDIVNEQGESELKMALPGLTIEFI